ncbi:DUF6804 family protein [Leeuwenhoekiella marinoflava]|uniref:SPW repeat-containing protein n=2 Tax=Leeuwenhoekiella marinoflava TaxID=988 RepID=A0A4Q0PLF4_9FLAO|nr:DUF6804 family protein [Leeuwenhoekiella marinoflava]RXG29875.1 hypothetical protein DSL99_1928 [Leeuwenhoekiella marinoflava]SHF27609.1 hypothetical protein SAMN02745246_02109 [Leeuwenhoekiella marinoflava DSM 3653]
MHLSVVIKLALSILFLLCLFQLPYGYYEFVRFCALIGFAWLAYTSYQKGNTGGAFIYLALAILFQPLLKIALGRTLWNIVDVLVAVGLLASLFLETEKFKN